MRQGHSRQAKGSHTFCKLMKLRVVITASRLLFLFFFFGLFVFRRAIALSRPY